MSNEEHTLDGPASPAITIESPVSVTSPPPPGRALAEKLVAAGEWPRLQRPLPKNAVEYREPDKAAEYILHSIEAPLARLKHKAKHAGLPESAARCLDKRIRTRYAEALDEVVPVTKETLEKRLSKRLDLIAGWLSDDKLEAKLEEAKLKDLGVYEGIMLTKLGELRGQPSIIIRTEDSLKLDEVATRLVEELQRRKGGTVELSERKVTMTDGNPV